MATPRKKKLPKAPKMPKSKTAAALNAYKKRVDDYVAKCTAIKKHNAGIGGLHADFGKQAERIRKARNN
jgi:hypothetical protein